MRRLVATFAAATGLMLALSASPALASGAASHSSNDVTGIDFVCGSTTYAISSGTVFSLFVGADSASGNVSDTMTIRYDMVAVDPSGNVYSIVGAGRSGFTYNVGTGAVQITTTATIQIVGKGGSAGSIDIVFHLSPNGDVISFDFGTC
jgi:hypothetical protein